MMRLPLTNCNKKTQLNVFLVILSKSYAIRYSLSESENRLLVMYIFLESAGFRDCEVPKASVG